MNKFSLSRAVRYKVKKFLAPIFLWVKNSCSSIELFIKSCLIFLLSLHNCFQISDRQEGQEMCPMWKGLCVDAGLCNAHSNSQPKLSLPNLWKILLEAVASSGSHQDSHRLGVAHKWRHVFVDHFSLLHDFLYQGFCSVVSQSPWSPPPWAAPYFSLPYSLLWGKGGKNIYNLNYGKMTETKKTV